MIICNFAATKHRLSRKLKGLRGKSGQRRAPYFLTGRGFTGNGKTTESATENYRPAYAG